MKKYSSSYFVIVGLLCIPGFLQGNAAVAEPKPGGALIENPEIRNLFTRGMLNVYHFAFRDADKQAANLMSGFPASPWGYVLSAQLQWWKLISGEEASETGKGFFHALTQAEKRISGIGHDEGLYCQIIISSLKSRYELLQKNYFPALILLNKSNNLLTAAQGKEHEYEAFYLTQGLFQYFISVAKEKLGLLSYLVQYKSDKQTGIQYLERLTHSSDVILKTESHYFLMKIFYEMENQPVKAKTHADYLVSIYPANLMFCYYNKMINDQVYGIPKQGIRDCPCCQKGFETAQLSALQIKYLTALLGQNK